MGQIIAVCISEAKGTPKRSGPEGLLVAGHGLAGDAHAGDWHRQVSILPLERIEAFRSAGADVEYGDFGENLVIADLKEDDLAIGDELLINGARLEVTQFGKECDHRCRIYEQMGDCIMPRHGMFVKVTQGGVVRIGDAVTVAPKSARDV